MHVVLQLDLDATPEQVWEMLNDPLALGQVVAPLLEIEPVGHRRFPPTWTRGDHLVRTRLFGLLAIGDQRIRLAHLPPRRRAHPRGLGRAGVGRARHRARWRHRMAVSSLPGGHTLYRDRLDFSAGVLTPIVWIGIWMLWQYRAIGIRRVIAERTAS